MPGPLKAGDRMVRPTGTRGGGGSGNGGGQPPRGPQDDPPRANRGQKRDRKDKRRAARRGGAGFLAARAVTSLFGLAAIVVVAGGVGGYVLFRHYTADLPSLDGLRSYQPPVMSRVYSSNMQLISELATERRIYTPFEDIPPLVAQAFISAEDQNFWHEPGIDPLAIIRAGVTDITLIGSGRRPIGASTITQQVAKNILLQNNINFARKIQEAVLAVRIDHAMSKQRVLEIYLNEIFLGEQAYGVAAAAAAYFDKPLDKLTIAQDAMLASLPKAPTNYDPYRNPQAALARRNWVIDRMADDGAITRDQATTAKAEPLLTRASPRPATVPGAGYFADAVRQQLVQLFGATRATDGGLVVYTSLDPSLQATADTSLRRGLVDYDRSHDGWRGPVTHVDLTGGDWQTALRKIQAPAGILPDWRLAVVQSTTATTAEVGWLPPGTKRDPIGPAQSGTLSLSTLRWARKAGNFGANLGPSPRRMTDVVQTGDVVMIEPDSTGKGDAVTLRQVPQVQGALVTMDPVTGRVLAMSGGWSYGLSQFNRVTQAQRQPGSGFKPIVYLTAMEQNIPPDATVLDAPFVVNMSDGTQYRPGNYEADFLGPIPLHQALEESINLATLHLAARIGLPAVAQTAQDFGVVDKMPLIYPAVLGAIETTMLRLAGAYAGFSQLGRQVTPSFIDRVEDAQGQVIYRAPEVNCGNCASPDPSQPPTLAYTAKQLADPQSTSQLVTMMQGVMTRGTGRVADLGLQGWTPAGKTGTTEDFQDAWFTGFTPTRLTSVWVGFDNPQSLGDNEQGATVAGPIWNRMMAAALADQPKIPFPVPPGIEMRNTGGVMEAFKTNEASGGDADVPGTTAAPGDTGAEAGGSVGGDGNASTAGTPGVGGSTAGNKIDNSVGGLY
ncbi:PBP1A family penicillin-binding protein [Acidisoma cellulosilytica]|uniref:Penicillin-binding protein 1A n=1 Tax=Acidisoma cellulosilyticum TaxID=2802395 RepID=A0A963YX69_9PROT|nr:PBP1A family penicillin-binding protein [Acidisoma cellulosilyticum]MCB8878636.1 PBP1A family penicillin-binding protein [Acidisoma cellulosilyticum]